MRRILIDIPLPDWLPADSLPLHSYGVMLALGFIAAILVAAWRSRREGENPDHIYNIAIFALVGGVVGARLFDVIEYADSRYPNWTVGLNVFDGLDLWATLVGGVVGGALAAAGVLPGPGKQSRRHWLAVAAWTIGLALVAGRGRYIYMARQTAMAAGDAPPYQGFIDALAITQGGLTVYGGFILAMVLIVPYLFLLRYRRGVNPLKLADIIAPSLALGLAFGRTGCFLNGCCYGAPTDLPWAFAWPEGSIPYAEGLHGPIHPAQLYGIANGLLLFAVLHLGYRWKRRHGTVLAWFFALYAVSRFLLEAVRTDEPKIYMWGTMSISQTVSVFMLVGAVAFLLALPRLPMSNLLWTAPARHTARPTRAERRRRRNKT